jgi:hypothetical protein
MSFHVNINAVPQPFDMTVSLDTQSSALQTPGRLAITQAATTAFKNSLTQLGITGQTRDAAVDTFTGTFTHTSGLPSGDSPATQSVIDSSYRNGNLAPSSQSLTDSMTKMTIALGAKGQQQSGGTDGGSGGGESWLEAIAKAMGQALGTMAQNLVNESNQLSSLSGDSSSTGAQQFQTTMASFQAHSQLFGMLSDAFSNAIKSIGQGMQTMGSKT